MVQALEKIIHHYKHIIQIATADFYKFDVGSISPTHSRNS